MLWCSHWSAASRLSTARLPSAHTRAHYHTHTHIHNILLLSVMHRPLSLLIQLGCASVHCCTFAIWWIPYGWQETSHFKAATLHSPYLQPVGACSVVGLSSTGLCWAEQWSPVQALRPCCCPSLSVSVRIFLCSSLAVWGRVACVELI